MPPNALAIWTANDPTPPGGADHQDRLPGSNLPVVANRLECCGASDGNGRRLLEREVRRLRRELAHSGGRVLSERAVADAEHGVADVEGGDIAAHGLDTAGYVSASNPDPRLPQAARRSERERHASHVVPVAGEEARCLDTEQYLTAARGRGIDVLEVQDVWSAISVLHDRLHRFLPRTISPPPGTAATLGVTEGGASRPASRSALGGLPRSDLHPSQELGRRLAVEARPSRCQLLRAARRSESLSSTYRRCVAHPDPTPPSGHVALAR
jgi:hypothetical protein